MQLAIAPCFIFQATSKLINLPQNVLQIVIDRSCAARPNLSVGYNVDMANMTVSSISKWCENDRKI